jgi:hypothetical protein
VEQIIGNAVPVNLARFIANAINEYLKDKNNNKVISTKQLTKQPALFDDDDYKPKIANAK